MTDPETKARAKKVVELMNQRLRTMSDAERDRLMQIFRSQAMTTKERAKATVALMDFNLALQRKKKSNT